MPCGGNRLPPNGTIVQIEAKPKRERKLPEYRKVVDYHCDQCGYSGLSPKHVCKPKAITWIESRQKTCARCPYSADDICTLYKSQHPDRDCVISVGVEMPFAHCPAGFWSRTELTCERCESVTFNERGVHKCKSCGWQPPSKISLPHVVKLKPEEPLAATQPLAVITMAIGYEAQQLIEITGPQMASYAERCKADFHVVTDDQSPSYRLANKFRLATLASNYERILFLDADVWVRSGAPNIFATHSKGYVWMHSDITKHQNDSLFAEAKRTATEQQVPEWSPKVLNSGVVLFDGSDRTIWQAPKMPFAPRHLAEQMWVEHQAIATGKQQDLDSRWNWQWYFKDFAAGANEAYFVHLAACPHDERIYRLRRLAAGLG